MRTPPLEEILADGGLPLGDDLRRTVDAWLAHLAHERGAADKTLEAYARDLRQFLAWLKGDLGHAPCLADLARLDAKMFRRFMAARRRDGLAGRSLARTMSALRTFFRWLEAEEITHNRGVMQVGLPKVPHGIPKPLTVGKAAEVIDARPEAELDWIAARDTAVLLLLYGSGLRISEALGLTPKDAPAAGRDVLHIRGKGGRERLVPVLPITQAAIARYMRLCVYPARPRRPAVPRRQGRTAKPTHRAAADGGPARRASACPTPRRRTPCGIRLPRICCRPAPTCGRSRSCWATPACRPRRPIPRSIASACSRCTSKRIRVPEVCARSRC